MEQKDFTGYASIDKPSYKYYSEDIDLKILEDVDMKMYDFMKMKNKGYEDDIIYSYFGEKRTLATFDEKVEETAKALKKYGLKEKDTITICAPNIPETMIYFYACNRIGVTPYLVDPRCSAKRIIDCMNVSNSKLLVSLLDTMNKNVIPNDIPTDNIVVISPHDDFIKSKEKLSKNALEVKALYTAKEKLYELKRMIKKDSKVLMQSEFMNTAKNYGKLVDSLYDPDIPAAIVNTSGTTGTPKGAMESNRGYNITSNQISYVAPHLKRGMTFFGYIPFFSLYGSAVGMHGATSHGIILDLIPKIDAHKFDKIYVDKKPNIVIGVPRLYEMFPDSDYINNTDLSFAELLVMGGDKISPSKLVKINETLEKNNCKHKITYGYGSTETMMIATTTDDKRSNVAGSCGILYPGVNVRITDRETLEELPYNQEGEIYADTPGQFMGYIGNLEETNNSIYIDEKTNTKYYKTGDKGYMNEDGILFHTGRYKRLMKRPDGHQVNSVPIEDAINTFDEVKDCAVVGIKNAYRDEGVIPTAFIELKDKSVGKDIFKEIVYKTREMLPGERDMALAYTLVDHIPYTINGKVDFSTLEKVKFEDIDYQIVDDPIFDGYFIKGEQLEKLNFTRPKTLIRKK